MGKSLTKLIEILYPRRCPLCFDIVIPKGELACPSCHAGRRRIEEPSCMKCGKPLDHEEKEYCRDCSKHSLSFERCYSLWLYDSIMKKSIAAFKYKGKREFADYYIAELLRKFEQDLRRLKPDAVIPVPVHAGRRRERGYNQAELLAKGVAQGIQTELVTDLLLRTGKTLPQKELSGRERSINLKDAFQVNPFSSCVTSRINKALLVDDIYTTGSTADACAGMLKKAGIPEIYVLCLCVGNGF